MEIVIEYLKMGGFAVYVWPALVITAIVMTGIALWSMSELRASRRRLEQLQPIADARRRERRGRRDAQPLSEGAE